MAIYIGIGAVCLLFVVACMRSYAEEDRRAQAHREAVRRKRKWMPDDLKTRALFDRYEAAYAYTCAGGKDLARARYELTLVEQEIDRRYVLLDGPRKQADADAKEQARRPAKMPLKSIYREEPL